MAVGVEAGEPVLKKITRREHSPTYAKLLANLHLRLKPRNLLQILANTDVELRQEIGGSTNKVESYNRFCD